MMRCRPQIRLPAEASAKAGCGMESKKEWVV